MTRLLLSALLAFVALEAVVKGQEQSNAYEDIDESLDQPENAVVEVVQEDPHSNSVHVAHNNPVGSDIFVSQTNPYNSSVHVSLNIAKDSKV